MTHTVIGFFRNSSDAYNAAEILKERGYDINNVDVSAGFGTEDYRSDKERDEKSGKIGNFFKSLFSDDKEMDDADRYSRAARDNSMVTVHASGRDEAERAADILDSCGAIDIDDSESYAGRGSEGFKGTDYGISRSGSGDIDAEYTDPDMDVERSGRVASGSDFDLRNEDAGNSFTTGDRDLTAVDRDLRLTEQDNDFDRERFTSDKDFDRKTDASIPVIEEEVNVGKREIRRGGVRLRSRIIERPVEETLRLREERVRVERTPADREATESELENFHEDTIEVHEYGEEPIVSKHSRVVEEVKVGKDVHERHETVRDKARKTEIDIENLEDEDNRTRSDKKR